MHQIIILDRAKRELKKLEVGIAARVLEVLERIRFRPHDYVTKLVGEKGYKMRVGDYRILLDIIDGDIVVWNIGHRKNVYNALVIVKA